MRCNCLDLPDGISITPDGVHFLVAHDYELKEIHKNVTVEVCQCKRCGKISIGWKRQQNTESEYIKALD